MTRKDYILIASALHEQHRIESGDTRYAVLRTATTVAYAIAKQNHSFNIEHFLSVVRGEKDANSKPEKAGR